VGTSTAGFVGEAPNATARPNEAVAINNWLQFMSIFAVDGSKSTALSHAVYGFFQNGGQRCYVVNVPPGKPIGGGGSERSGLDLFEPIDEIAIVAAPGHTDPADYDAILSHVEKKPQYRVAILDSPEVVPDLNLLTKVATVKSTASAGGSSGDKPKAADAPAGYRPTPSEYAAFYFPWITVRDPLSPTSLVNVAPSGHLAGIWARSDATRGVHKAPANEVVRGALNLSYLLTSAEQGNLNQNGVNCIRFFGREGILVWGARTLAASASEFRYLNVRRLFIMIEKSIADSTRWIVFEPNNESLWKSIRGDISAFLTRVWRDGALMGRTPQEAFFVKCDEETNPPDTVDAGMVVTLVGIAPVKPAEFVVFRISQSAGGVETSVQGGA
jgi:uncharacterized protein